MIETGWYEHFKGSFYYVIGEAIHTETREALVLYISLLDDTIQARPMKMFFEEVEPGVKRFKKI